MRTGIIAFLLGNVFLLYRPVLPLQESLCWLAGLILFLSLLLYKSNILIVRHCSFCRYLFHIILFCMAGFTYTGWIIHTHVPQLDWQNREGKDLYLSGIVASSPDVSDKRQRFDFIIDGIVNHETLDRSFTGKVRLSWYESESAVKIGQHWQFMVRLKRPNGTLNPGGFDYEKWLFQNRILATGYIRNSSLNRFIPKPYNSFISIAQVRQNIADTLDRVLENSPYKGLIKALALGIKGDIAHSQWKTFIDTGTNHLIAISGLHIGLMASLTWVLVNWLWRLSHSLNQFIPAFYIASCCAFLVASCYAALAGFAIPTQRALIMLGVVFIVASFKRELPVSYTLLYSLIIVLLVDPLSSLATGFWLSFGAVAVILFAFANRFSGHHSSRHLLFYSAIMH